MMDYHVFLKSLVTWLQQYNTVNRVQINNEHISCNFSGIMAVPVVMVVGKFISF